jgi:hypothetical protein
VTVVVASCVEQEAIGVTRELRVLAGLDTSALNELATSISISTAIQSKYGAFACYRQLFEAREEKRRTALSPTVDADDPPGRSLAP